MIKKPYCNTSYAENETLIYENLSSRGYNLAQICGVLAQASERSGFNSTIDTSSGCYGILNWSKEECDQLKTRYGTQASSVDKQLDYICNCINSCNSEFNNQENSSAGARRSASLLQLDLSLKVIPTTLDLAITYFNYYDIPYLSNYQHTPHERTIYQKLRVDGYSLAQACAILANIEYESKFNPYALNTSEEAFGLCQWRDSRRNRLHSLYGNTPSVVNQIDYISVELNSDEKSARDKFMSRPNTRTGAGEAGYAFAKYYERCHESYFEERKSRALDYWDFYVSKDIPLDETLASPVSSQGGSGIPSYGGSIATINPYTNYIEENLSKVTASGFDYGYLIDLTYGGEFKFYIPEFSESAGANWGDISIPGRSVSLKHYNNTESRSISISLELYAGVGLYTTSENDSDIVGKMHQDANFVKSLEYPDYSTSVVKPPATVQLILGSNINLVGIVTDVNVEHLKPLDSQNRSMYLKVSFKVTQQSVDPPGQADIRKGIYSILNTANPSSLS